MKDRNIRVRKLLMCIVFIGIALISGCGKEQEHNAETIASNKEETVCEECITVQSYEVNELETDDWGLSDINELFETWGWYPSSNPTDIKEIANGSGQDVPYIAAQKEKIEQILLDRYQCFEQCDIVMLDGKENGILGRAYLRNSNETCKDSNMAIFLSFFYLFETRELEVVEVVETTSGIIDYKTVFEYGDDGTTKIHTEDGLRLLDIQAELNPVEEFVPVNGLGSEELKLYVESIFLDIYRCPNNLKKYNKVFDEETYTVLESAQYYYDKPKDIYDFANTSLYTDTQGTVYLGSQFQASLLETVIIELHIDFEYDKANGNIVVTDASMYLVEKP